MKVKAIAKDTGRWMTLDEKPLAQRLVKEEGVVEADIREVTRSAADAWLQGMTEAGRIDSDWSGEVIRADAQVAKNCRIDRNYYFEGSWDLDIWIDATVETLNGFLKFGFYLSEAWSICSDNYGWFLGRVYAHYYTEREA